MVGRLVRVAVWHCIPGFVNACRAGRLGFRLGAGWGLARALAAGRGRARRILESPGEHSCLLDPRAARLLLQCECFALTGMCVCAPEVVRP